MNKIYNSFSILKGPIKEISGHPISFFLLILGAAQAVLTFYPGSMSFDSDQQFQQALSGTYEDWHPPIMAWLWHNLLWIKKGPQPMLFFHVGMFWLGLFLIWYRFAQKKRYAYLIVPLLGFLPSVISMMGVIWKDIGLGSSLVLVVGLLVFNHRYKKLSAFLILILLFYGTAVRHNGIAATLPFYILCPYLFNLGFHKQRKWAALYPLLTGVSLVLLTIVFIGLWESYALNAKKTYQYQYVFFHDLSFIGEKIKLEMIPEAFRTKNYSPLTVNNVLKDLRTSGGFIFPVNAPFRPIRDIVEINKLTLIWLKAIWNYFPYYFQLRTQMYKSLHSIGFGQCRINHYHIPLVVGGGISWVQPWRNFLNSTTIHIASNTPLFSGWFYLLLALLGLISTLLFKGEFRVQAILCFISSVLYSIAYFPSVGTCDFRFIWPISILSCLGWVLVISNFKYKKCFDKLKKIRQT